MANKKKRKKKEVEGITPQLPVQSIAAGVMIDLRDGSITLRNREIESGEDNIQGDGFVDDYAKIEEDTDASLRPLSEMKKMTSEDEKKAMDAYNELMLEEKELLDIRRMLDMNRKIDVHIEEKFIERQIEQDKDPDGSIDFSDLASEDVLAIITRKLDLTEEATTIVTASSSTSSLCLPLLASPHATSTASTILKALKRLQELTTINRANRIVVGENNGCSILLCVLRKYATVAMNSVLINDMIEAACMVVANLAYNSNNKSKMGESGMCEFIIDLLGTHSKIVSVVKMGFWALINLAVSHPENVNRFYACSGVEVLINIMSIHFSDVGIMQWGCLGVAYLATKKENVVVAREAGICEIILRAFDRYFENIGVIEEICRAVGAITYEDEGSRVKYSALGGGLERLLQCMDKYNSNAEILYWICMALVNLCRENDVNKIKLGSLGTIVHIVNVLEHHFGNNALVDQCIWALQVLVSTQGNAQEIGSTACPMIVKVMISYYDHHGIIERSSKILAYLTTAGTPSFKENIKRIRETESGLEIILIAIEAHYKSNVHITLYWLIVLLNNMCNEQNKESRVLLTSIDEKGHAVTLNDENRSTFQALRGFDIVLNTLEQSIDDATLTEEVCKSLNNLIGDYDPIRCKESWTKSYPIFLLVIAKHVHNVPICYLTMRALYIIILSVRNFVDTKLGVVGLLQVLNIHSDVNIILWTCKVMNSMSLCAGSTSWGALGTEGACEVIVDVLRQHHENADIAEHGCWLIHSLAVDKKNATLLGAENNDCCQLLLRTLEIHIFSANVAERVCCAINNISFNYRASSTTLGSMGALKLLINSLKIHHQSPDVSYWCCSAINNLVCDSKSNLRIVGDIGGCEAIVEMLKRFITHCAVTEQACIAIQNLSFFAANRMRFLEYHVIEVLKSAIKVHGSGKEDAKHIDVDERLISNVGPEILKTLKVFTGESDEEKYCHVMPSSIREFLNFGYSFSYRVVEGGRKD